MSTHDWPNQVLSWRAASPAGRSWIPARSDIDRQEPGGGDRATLRTGRPRKSPGDWFCNCGLPGAFLYGFGQTEAYPAKRCVHAIAWTIETLIVENRNLDSASEGMARGARRSREHPFDSFHKALELDSMTARGAAIPTREAPSPALDSCRRRAAWSWRHERKAVERLPIDGAWRPWSAGHDFRASEGR